MNKREDFPELFSQWASNPTESLMPRCVWRSWALNVGHPLLGTQDLSTEKLEALLPALYPQLSLVDLARLQLRLNKEDYSAEALFNAYKMRWDARLEKLVQALLTLPESFLSWASAHGLSAKDLQPLNSLTNLKSFHPHLESLAQAKPSRSLGAQILELLVELSLLETPAEALQPATTNDLWLAQLQSLRYPQSQKKDQQAQQAVQDLPWTKDIQKKWTRQGDKSEWEIRFRVAGPQDLEKKIQALQRVQESWKS